MTREDWITVVAASLRAGQTAAHAVAEADVVAREYLKRFPMNAGPVALAPVAIPTGPGGCMHPKDHQQAMHGFGGGPKQFRCGKCGATWTEKW